MRARLGLSLGMETFYKDFNYADNTFLVNKSFGQVPLIWSVI